MKIKRHLDDLSCVTRPIILAMGSFDGIHLGHQALLSHAKQEAESTGRETWVLTFDPLPAKILRSGTAPPLLTSTTHKLRLLEQHGIDGCLVIPFTRQLAAQEPEDFIARLCKAVPRLAEIVVGSNWTFGRKARGNPDLVNALAPEYGFEVTVISPVLHEGEPISSTRIRKTITAGHLEHAQHMLGRPFSIFGEVVKGKQVGRKLGFPTANISAFNEVLPLPGIYAARLVVAGEAFNGAAYLPAPPTDGPGNIRSSIAEIFLFDTDRDLYGREAEMFFVQFIRAGQQFDSDRLLKEQISRDVDKIKRIFEKPHIPRA